MNPITTANKLKTLRNLKGLTPEQVAKEAELNLNDYKALESGKTAVSEEKLIKACDALGVDVEEWFETDKSHVAINTGEIKSGGNYCENCNFYGHSDEDMEMLKSLSKMMQVILEKIDTDAFSRKLDQMFRKDKDKPKDKEK